MDARQRGLVATSVSFFVLVACACCGKPAPPPPSPPAVKVSAVLERDVPVWVEEIGETRGSEEVEVRARVQGFLQTVSFQEGSHIRKGQLLFTIDPREYETTVDQAEAQLARAQADLVRLEQDVARYKPLVDRNAIPRQQYETAVAQANAGRAAVEAAEATLRGARIDLGYTRIVAPTDGIVGKLEISSGNLVGRGGATLLTTISQVDPIYLRFSISERDYLAFANRRKEAIARLLEQGETLEGARAARGPDETPFEMILADGKVHPHRGRLVFADRLVDPTTGTLLMEVSFPNPDSIVRPGQYGRARVAVDVVRGAILVPQKAVSELQGLRSVYVLGEGDKVEVRTVTMGPRVGTLWAVASGLKPTDRVVVEGIQKINPGIVVQPTVVPIEG